MRLQRISFQTGKNITNSVGEIWFGMRKILKPLQDGSSRTINFSFGGFVSLQNVKWSWWWRLRPRQGFPPLFTRFQGYPNIVLCRNHTQTKTGLIKSVIEDSKVPWNQVQTILFQPNVSSPNSIVWIVWVESDFNPKKHGETTFTCPPQINARSSAMRYRHPNFSSSTWSPSAEGS